MLLNYKLIQLKINVNICTILDHHDEVLIKWYFSSWSVILTRIELLRCKLMFIYLIRPLELTRCGAFSAITGLKIIINKNKNCFGFFPKLNSFPVNVISRINHGHPFIHIVNNTHPHAAYSTKPTATRLHLTWHDTVYGHLKRGEGAFLLLRIRF